MTLNNTSTYFRVEDDHGVYGNYRLKADAVSACQYLDQNDTNPRMIKVSETKEDWTISYTNEGVYAFRKDWDEVKMIMDEAGKDGLNYEVTYVIHYGFERAKA